MSKIKYLLVLCFTLCALSVSAQKVRGGAFAGYTNNATSLFDAKSGYQVGAKAEWDIVKGLYLQGGLAIEQRYYSGGLYLWYNQKWHSRPVYLNVPIYVGYKWNVAKNVKLNAAVDPKFSIGLFGKHGNKTLSDDQESVVANTGYHGNAFTDHYLNRFDVSIGAEVGVELFNHYQFSVGYNKGFMDITKLGNDHNRQWQVSLEYMF